MTILGIDPGKKGALALYIPETDELHVEDVPTLDIKGKTVVDHYGLARLVDDWAKTSPKVFLELVGSMPGEGHAGAFDFGRTNGLLLGVVVAHFLRLEMVSPSVWKRALAVKGDKDVSRQRASALMPRHAGHWPLKKHDGRAEAALIAYYGATR